MPRPSGGFQERIRHYTSAPFQNLFAIKKLENKSNTKMLYKHFSANRGTGYTTPKKFQRAALLLRLGSPSTLIRLENEAFSKTLFKPEEFENEAFQTQI